MSYEPTAFEAYSSRLTAQSFHFEKHLLLHTALPELSELPGVTGNGHCYVE